MPLFILPSDRRPNRLEDKKDRQYHIDYARWSLGAINHPQHQNFMLKAMTNWSFYKGGDGQWIFDEDLESFFTEETGNVRNRLKISKNLIRPMVEQYVGNAIRLAFNARAQSASEFVLNRREQELNKIKFIHKIRDDLPVAADDITERFGLGNTVGESNQIFENRFVDKYERNRNNFLKYLERAVDIEGIKIDISKDLAITGLGVYKGIEYNMNYVGERTDPMFFFYDRGAKKSDLSDAEYMGEWYFMDAPTIFERWQNLTKDERRNIERYSKDQSIDVHRLVHRYYNQGSTAGRIPIYEIYWRDTEEQEYGWVKDRHGYPWFTRINHENSDFTNKDLIDPPENAQKDILKGKKKRKIYVDVLRYCIFTPREEVATQSSTDIVYEFGEVPYSEKYKFDPSSAPFPYKCHTWAYDKGDILSPIDDAISPQRFINRLLSIAESHVNNVRGSGAAIAQDAVDPEEGEAGIERRINQGKTIFVDTSRTGSVANSVSQYNVGITGSTMQLFNVVQEMQTSLQDITGVNEALTGSIGGSGALVGVIEQQISRGTLLQEPFYYALTNIMTQAYRHMLSVGMRIYVDNPRKLAIITGDIGAEEIVITKEMAIEDFRLFIERVAPESTREQNANNLLITLLQAGLIDQKVFANLFGRSDSDQIADAMRTYQSQLSKAQRDSAREQEQASRQIAAAAEQERVSAEAKEDAAILREDIDKEKDRDHEIEKISARGAAQIARDQARQ